MKILHERYENVGTDSCTGHTSCSDCNDCDANYGCPVLCNWDSNCRVD